MLQPCFLHELGVTPCLNSGNANLLSVALISFFLSNFYSRGLRASSSDLSV